MFVYRTGNNLFFFNSKPVEDPSTPGPARFDADGNGHFFTASINDNPLAARIGSFVPHGEFRSVSFGPEAVV